MWNIWTRHSNNAIRNVYVYLLPLILFVCWPHSLLIKFFFMAGMRIACSSLSSSRFMTKKKKTSFFSSSSKLKISRKTSNFLNFITWLTKNSVVEEWSLCLEGPGSEVYPCGQWDRALWLPTASPESNNWIARGAAPQRK